jgi:hypothetical protein
MLPAMVFLSCSPTKCPVASLPAEDRERYNTEEPTLQSAEDAMKTNFNEDSFK